MRSSPTIGSGVAALENGAAASKRPARGRKRPQARTPFEFAPRRRVLHGRERCTPAHWVVIAPHTSRGAKPSPTPRRRYAQLRHHLASALRLRRGLKLEIPEEAITEPGGRVVHATGDARERDVRETMRRTVSTRERAHSSLRRRDPDEALDPWQGFVSGRWSLIHRFESDGRRYVVALRNDYETRDPRRLTAREQRVALLAGSARSTHEPGRVDPSKDRPPVPRHPHSRRRKIGTGSSCEASPRSCRGGRAVRARPQRRSDPPREARSGG